MTRWLVYELSVNRARYYSLPFTVPYFAEDVVPKLEEGLLRKWSKLYTNGSVTPKNAAHYIVFYVENTTGAARDMRLQFIDYAEEYPD